MSPAASSTTRRSADERREEIVTAATRHFARSGYTAASTEAIARDAGISQPYVFRLFGTKKELFLACHARAHDAIQRTFRDAAASAPPDGRLPAMGGAYTELLADREVVLFQMQSYAACADPEIQAHVRGCFAAVVRLVQSLGGIGPAEAWEFFSTGMLLNVIAALDLEAIAGEEEWAARWMQPREMLAELRGPEWCAEAE